MQSVIDDLYDGEIRPSETLMPQDPKYREMSKQVGEEKKYFSGILDESDRKRFDELDDLQTLVGRMIEKEFFAYGLKLGIMLMLEVLGDGDEVEVLRRKTE